MRSLRPGSRIYRLPAVTAYYPMAICPDDAEHSFDPRLHQPLMDKRELSRDILLPPSASNADITELYNGTVGGTR